jgi:hypothetical protein
MIKTSEQAIQWIGNEVAKELRKKTVKSTFLTAYVFERKGQYWLNVVFDTKQVQQAIKAEAWYDLAEQTAIRLRDVQPVNF